MHSLTQSYVELEAEQAATDGNDDPCIAALLSAASVLVLIPTDLRQIAVFIKFIYASILTITPSFCCI